MKLSLDEELRRNDWLVIYGADARSAIRKVNVRLLPENRKRKVQLQRTSKNLYPNKTVRDTNACYFKRSNGLRCTCNCFNTILVIWTYDQPPEPGPVKPEATHGRRTSTTSCDWFLTNVALIEHSQMDSVKALVHEITSLKKTGLLQKLDNICKYLI